MGKWDFKWDELSRNIDAKLEILEISDVETFQEYILQILQDTDVSNEEKAEIIQEFLTASCEEGKEQIVKEFVQLFLEEANSVQRDIKLEEELEARARIENKIKVNDDKTVIDQRDGVERRSKTKEMSREEREERERFLANYGYEVEDVEENDAGESEIVFKSQKKVASGIENISLSNAMAVKEKEAAKKLLHKKKHDEETLRNKADLIKQKQLKEEKKKGTQKREKQRL